MTSGKGTTSYVIFGIALLLVLVQFKLTSAEGELKHGQKCEGDNECESGYCEPHTKTCDCGKLSGQEKLFYDDDLKMCFSRVGQLCTFSTLNDGLAPFICIPNAECISSNAKSQSKSTFGVCHCKQGHSVSDFGKRCIFNAELRTGKITSMDQVRPEGWSKSGGASAMLRQCWSGSYVGSLSAIYMILRINPFR